MKTNFTRRGFLAWVSTGAAACALPRIAHGASREIASAADAAKALRFRVTMAGFGDASAADIEAVLRSAAGELWRYCPESRFEQAGFEIYHHERYPFTHHDLSKDGWIKIGLAVEGRLWARFAFQFSHEFAHALANHSNDARKAWRHVEHAQQWLEESLCETASLFALRAMAVTWKTNAPYSNWKSYSAALADYAEKRMTDPKHQLPEDKSFAAWFAEEERGLREKWAQREKNTIIARHLLPVFEAEPRGWEAMTWLRHGPRETDKTLAKHFADWKASAPEQHRAFIGKLAAVFGVKG